MTDFRPAHLRAPFASRVADWEDYSRMPRVSDIDFKLRIGDIVVLDSRGRMRYARVTKVNPTRVLTEYATETAMRDAAKYGTRPTVTRKPVRLDDVKLRFAERPKKAS